MLVLRLGLTGRDGVNVHVEDRGGGGIFERHTYLLGYFALRGCQQARVGGLDMPPGLYPETQLAMKDEQQRRTVGGKDEGAGSQVPGPILAAGPGLDRIEQPQYPIVESLLARIRRSVFL